MPRAAAALSRTCLRWRCGRCRWTAGGRRGNSRRPKPRTEQPDVHESGLVSAARLQMRFDLWRYPFGGVTADNVQRGQQVTRQTGQVLTPTAAPDGDQIAYLSDSGGHSNIWVTSTQGATTPDHLRRRSHGGDRRPDLVAGRTVDCVRVVQGKRRIRFRRVAGQTGWQRTAPARSQGPGRRLVIERRRDLLRGDRVQCHEEDLGEWRRAGDRAIGPRAQHDRRAWIDGLLSRGACAHGRATGVRDSRRTSRQRSGARHQDDRRVARGLLAGPIQPVALTRRQMAGDAAQPTA